MKVNTITAIHELHEEEPTAAREAVKRLEEHQTKAKKGAEVGPQMMTKEVAQLLEDRLSKGHQTKEDRRSKENDPLKEDQLTKEDDLLKEDQ